ncbi:MAG: PEP-CTERM sorting domain-containing protein [Myxococcota bacterium]
MGFKNAGGTLTRLAVASVIALLAAQAGAAPVIDIAIDSLTPEGIYNEHYEVSQAGTANPDGSFGLSGNSVGYASTFNCVWDLTVNQDPQITSTFTLTNLSASTQNFVMTITLPIANIGPSTVQGGYFGDADPLKGTTYTDTSGNSDVTLGNIGSNPFYQAIVNSLAVSQSLGFFGPTGLNANGGPGIYGTLSQQAWGTPIPSAPFGPASGNIIIKWQFSLTGGDSVATKGFFQVEQVRVPEPTALVLVGFGLAALAGLRRRAS